MIFKRALPAVVLALCLMLGLPQRADATYYAQGSLTGVGQTVVAIPQDDNSVTINLTGNFVGTIVVEGTLDNANYFVLTVSPYNGGQGGTPQSSITANGLYAGVTTGLLSVRARVSAYTSGTGTIQLLETSGSLLFTTASTASPAYTRIQDGVSTLLATVNSAGAVDSVGTGNGLLNVGSYLLGFNGTTWDRLRSVNTGQLVVTVADGVAGTKLNILAPSADGFASQSGAAAYAQIVGYNGATWDRLRVDGNATGVLRVTTGGSTATAIAAGTAGPTVIKASGGRLVQFLVTTAGTISETCFDNASTGTGTIIGITPATTTVGQILKFDNPAANGITCTGGAGSPALTVSFY